MIKEQYAMAEWLEYTYHIHSFNSDKGAVRDG